MALSNANNDIEPADLTVCYRVHDNGGRPFTVLMKPAKDCTGDDRLFDVSVYKNNTKRYDVTKHADLKDTIFDDWDKNGRQLQMVYAPSKKRVLHFKNVKVFVGKSPKTASTLFSGGSGSKFKGNSLLVEVDSLAMKYVYIGVKIYSFTSLAPIVKYWSPVGNNDVPYPYAIDKNLNHYLMIENVVLTKVKSFPKYSKRPNKFDPYSDYYYGHTGGPGTKIPGYAVYMPESDVDPQDRHDPEEDVFRMSYRPEYQSRHLKRFQSHFKFEFVPGFPAFNANGQLPQSLSEDEVLTVVNDFAQQHGYQDIPDRTVICERRY